MATLSVTIEEIKKCLFIKEKEYDCVQLLYNAETKKLLESKSKENEAGHNSKKSELEQEERKLKEAEALWSEKLNNYNSAKNVVDNAQSNYNSKNNEKESARQHLESEISAENNQRNLAYSKSFLQPSKTKYTNTQNYENNYDLLIAYKNNRVTKNEHYTDILKTGPDICWGYSPGLHQECIDELNEKIAEFEKYHRYEGDTARARSKLAEKERELSSEQTKLNESKEGLKSLEAQKNNAHTELNVIKSKVEKLRKEVEQSKVNEEKKALEELASWIDERKSKKEEAAEPEIDNEVEENTELELVQENEAKAEL